MRNRLMTLLFVSLIPTVTVAHTPTCEKLTAEQKTLATKILSDTHPYECCDDTIANCLKGKKVCALAWRLSENVCRRIAQGQNEQTIRRGLSRREWSMRPVRKKSTIDLTNVPFVGSQSAPVVLVEYACVRCPFCAKITPDLHGSIINGSLKDKVRLYFKPFPLRSHEHSKESGLALMAAQSLGKFWPFLLHTYRNFDLFCVDKLNDWAAATGMDPAQFELITLNPKTRKLLVDSKKEGIVNGVDATPTFFINGRKYQGNLSTAELVDVIEEEYDALTGVRFKGSR